MNFADILDDIGLERRLRLLGLLEPDPPALVLWSRAVVALLDDVEWDRLDHAFGFAKGIEYRHVGVKSETYFSHLVPTEVRWHCIPDFGGTVSWDRHAYSFEKMF